METSILEKELATFEAVKSSLLPRERGRFVLIHGDRVVGLFDTDGEAADAGYRQLGYVPFLVKEVQEVETPIELYSDLLAV